MTMRKARKGLTVVHGLVREKRTVVRKGATITCLYLKFKTHMKRKGD